MIYMLKLIDWFGSWQGRVVLAGHSVMYSVMYNETFQRITSEMFAVSAYLTVPLIERILSIMLSRLSAAFLYSGN